MKKNTKSNTQNKTRKPANIIYLRIIDFIATGCYTGYLPKAPGTWGSLLAVAFFWLVIRYFDEKIIWYHLFIMPVLFIIGVFVTGEYNRLHGKHDAPEANFDEVVGQLIALFPVAIIYSLDPKTYVRLDQILMFFQITLVSFGLFRFFDILKPLGIKRIEKLPGGWGVMLDDILAAVYAVLVFLLGTGYGLVLIMSPFIDYW